MTTQAHANMTHVRLISAVSKLHTDTVTELLHAITEDIMQGDTIDCDIHEDEDDEHHVDREKEEKQIRRRRWLKLVSIVIMFLVCGIILAMSVAHDLEARAGDDLEWDEFTCPDNDDACAALLCPVGMVWEGEDGRCREMSGYSCCTTCTHEYLCYEGGEAGGVKCCYGLGVVPAAYKQTCRQGYLWVQWKKKCLRKN